MILLVTSRLLARRYTLRVRLYKPQSSSPLQALSAWWFGIQPEYADPTLAAQGEGREGMCSFNLCMLLAYLCHSSSGVRYDHGSAGVPLCLALLTSSE